MTVAVASDLSLELLRAKGTDGTEYVVRPFSWSLAKLEHYYHKFEKYRIFSDDIPKTPDAFMAYVGTAGTLWFEAVPAGSEENVGFIYVTDLRPSWVDKRYISCFFHAVVWDSNANTRLPVAKAVIEALFKLFRLHRLEAAVPLKYGGAIRVLKRLGFKDEGVIREARRYNGVWFNVLLLSILEHEVNNGRA